MSEVVTKASHWRHELSEFFVMIKVEYLIILIFNIKDYLKILLMKK